MAKEGFSFIQALPFLAMAIPGLRELLSSQFGGLAVSLFSGEQYNEQLAKFEEDLKTSNNQVMAVLRDQVGISQPGFQIREEVTDPGTRESIQAQIDAGTVPEGWEGQFVERAPAEFPSAIQGAFDVQRQGIEFAEEHLDPGAAVERYQELFDPISEELEALPGEVTAASERVQGLYGEAREGLQAGAAAVGAGFAGLRGQLQAGAADLAGGYQDILGRARGLVSGLGEAERQDINRRFGEAGTTAQMNLAARGLAGSTIAPSIASGFERERSTALLGLQEQTARQQLGVEATFGLPGLTAQERLLGAGINLGATGLGAAERFVGAGANVATQGAQAAQFGDQLFAGTQAAALGARGAIAGGEFGAYNEATMNFLSSLGLFGPMGFQTQMQGAGMALGAMPYSFVQPSPNQPVNVYGYGGAGQGGF